MSESVAPVVSKVLLGNGVVLVSTVGVVCGGVDESGVSGGPAGLIGNVVGVCGGGTSAVIMDNVCVEGCLFGVSVMFFSKGSTA